MALSKKVVENCLSSNYEAPITENYLKVNWSNAFTGQKRATVIDKDSCGRISICTSNASLSTGYNSNDSKIKDLRKDDEWKLALLRNHDGTGNDHSLGSSPTSSRSRASSDNPLSEEFSETMSNEKIPNNNSS